MTRLIDADKLRTVESIQKGDFNSIESIQKWIDTAPTVEYPFYAEAYQTGYEEALNKMAKEFNQKMNKQPLLFTGCALCDSNKTCPDAFDSTAVHCNAYMSER